MVPDNQNKQLLQQRLQAREDERRRISRELHDGVAQEIAGLQMSLRQAKYLQNKEDILAILSQTDAQLDAIHIHLRQFAAVLRPDVLVNSGLTVAFRSYFARVETTYKVLVNFEDNLGISRFDADLELAFYRVCQEAVLNACKHSGCQEVSVSMRGRYQDDEFGNQQITTLCLQVEDIGRGFLPDDRNLDQGYHAQTYNKLAKNRVGLSAMKEWAEFIDGELTIDSLPGAGTTIRLTSTIHANGEG
ncbi:MAG: ATP-binding protein [Peptococcaceae bacterium]|nr:ATP-binding protein [Peptococcaceae bacterium]